ncbi:MAG: hypothetical protein Q9181_008262 [Wetmoreana brouardii]
MDSICSGGRKTTLRSRPGSFRLPKQDWSSQIRKKRRTMSHQSKDQEPKDAVREAARRSYAEIERMYKWPPGKGTAPDMSLSLRRSASLESPTLKETLLRIGKTPKLEETPSQVMLMRQAVFNGVLSGSMELVYLYTADYDDVGQSNVDEKTVATTSSISAEADGYASRPPALQLAKNENVRKKKISSRRMLRPQHAWTMS